MAAILVVDDSPTVGSTVEWLLRDHGHTVCVAHDGLAALNALKEFIPDLILLDIRLPNIDGVQLCRIIRRKATYASLPIVMLSGLSGADDIQRALEAGANDYIVKPVNDSKLVAVLNQQLGDAKIV